MEIDIGSIVMWNNRSSDDFGDIGVVTTIDNERRGVVFNIVWSDDTHCRYDTVDIKNNIKILSL